METSANRQDSGNLRAVGCKSQSLSIVFVCAVNTKLTRSVPKFRIFKSGGQAGPGQDLKMTRDLFYTSNFGRVE
jgi:hypothetical protein